MGNSLLSVPDQAAGKLEGIGGQQPHAYMPTRQGPPTTLSFPPESQNGTRPWVASTVTSGIQAIGRQESRAHKAGSREREKDHREAHKSQLLSGCCLLLSPGTTQHSSPLGSAACSSPLWETAWHLPCRNFWACLRSPHPGAVHRTHQAETFATASFKRGTCKIAPGRARLHF